jgi:alkylation response protein AidB-like acyl-CoA dehydrogenase
MMRESNHQWAQAVMPQYIESSRLNFYQHMATKGTAQEIPILFPHAFIKEAAARGLLGMVIPERYGGLGLIPIEQVTAFEPIPQVDAGGGLKILVQNTLGAYPIIKRGTDAQKEKYLPSMASGELLGCIGLSEPGIGSDLMSLRCRAEKVDGGWMINGEKIWITSAEAAGIMVLAARTGTQESRGEGISGFIIPLDHQSPQLDIHVIPKHGQHTSQFYTVAFKDYFVSDKEDPLLGDLNGGRELFRNTLTASRIWIATQGTGVALHAYEMAVHHANELEMYGRKLVDLPLMKRNLDHMKREIDIARHLVRRAAWAEQQEDAHAHVWASLAKVVAGELAFLASHDAELIYGATGYIMESEPGYIATDAEPIRIYEGAREVQVNLLLKYLTEEQLRLPWPRADHPVKPIEELPTADEVIATIESWEIKSRNAK